MMKLSRALQSHYRLYRHIFGIRKCVFQAMAGHKETYFFDRGWGNEERLARLADATLSRELAPISHIEWDEPTLGPKASRHRNGRFTSPMPEDLIHPEARQAFVQLHEPAGATFNTPLCVVFAMTGDEGFDYRFRTLSQQLIEKGISTLLLENSYYGARKPADQRDYKLQTVEEMLSMSVASVLEGKAILRHLRDEGHTRLGVAGVSQGGMVAALVGAQAPFPVAIASSLAAHAPDEVLARGLLSCFVEWPALLPEDKSFDPRDRLRQLFQVGDVTYIDPPVRPEAALLLGAKRDVVIPRDSISKIHKHWKGSKLRWIPGTHVTSIFLHSRAFRRLILDSFEALA
jgi:hypothetical protein